MILIAVAAVFVCLLLWYAWVSTAKRAAGDTLEGLLSHPCFDDRSSKVVSRDVV
jgi:hypothetical protein